MVEFPGKRQAAGRLNDCYLCDYNKPMRKLRFAFVFLLILCITSARLSANDRNTFEETAGKGLEIQTNPLGARVYIDGVDYGYTPIYIDNLKPGRYRIELYKDEYEEYNNIIYLNEDSRLIITVNMELARTIANITVQKAQDSPQDLPFAPLLFSLRQDNSLTAVPLSYDNKAQLNVALNHRHQITARAFGWEDETISILVKDQKPEDIIITMKSAPFKMENASASRRRFNPTNPNNLGAVEYRFEVSTYASGVFTIYDSNENEVFKKQLDKFDTWVQLVTWNGRDFSGSMLPQGLYTVVIEAQDETGEIHSLKLETEINYSINIFPLSLDSAASGLSFVPMAHVLPALSYQFKAGVFFGSLGIPFNISMRISPFNKFETTAVFNINADKTQTGWGISGSVKYNFLDGAGFPLALSASASCAWASSAGEYMLSPGKGIGIHIPLSLELAKFSIAFCPSVFWHGFEGTAPELLLGAGLLYRGNRITGGVSARGEIDFANKNFRFLTGAEVHYIPPASNFIITAQGGIITSQNIDWYAGLGIGFIY